MSERKEVTTKNIKPFDELEERYLREHPEEIDEYILQISKDYAQDNDLRALMASVRIIYRIRTGKEIVDSNPDLGMVRSTLQEMGYTLK